MRIVALAEARTRVAVPPQEISACERELCIISIGVEAETGLSAAKPRTRPSGALSIASAGLVRSALGRASEARMSGPEGRVAIADGINALSGAW